MSDLLLNSSNFDSYNSQVFRDYKLIAKDKIGNNNSLRDEFAFGAKSNESEEKNKLNKPLIIGGAILIAGLGLIFRSKLTKFLGLGKVKDNPSLTNNTTSASENLSHGGSNVSSPESGKAVNSSANTPNKPKPGENLDNVLPPPASKTETKANAPAEPPNTSKPTEKSTNNKDANSAAPKIVFDAEKSRQLGLDYVEKYQKNAEKSYMKGQPTHRNMTDQDFEVIWARRKEILLNGEISNIDECIKDCINKGCKGGNFGLFGFNSAARPDYVQFAETIANKNGYTMKNIRPDSAGVTIVYDLEKI